MRFESRALLVRAPGAGQTEPSGEHAVFAVDPRQGNDSALLAVFDNPRSPAELAAFLNWAYDKYLREAPMEAATDPVSPGEASRPAAQNTITGGKPSWMSAMADCHGC